MMDIIKSNLYKYSKSIWGYLFIAIMIIFTGSLVYLEITAHTGEPNGAKIMFILFGQLSYFGFLFAIFIAMNMSESYKSGAVKSIFGRGIGKEKYLIGNILTVSGLYIIAWGIFVAITTGVNSIFVSFGTIKHPFNIFLVLVMLIIFAIAMITMVCVLTMVFKNGLLGFIIAWGIINAVGVMQFFIGFFSAFPGNIGNSFVKMSLSLKYVAIDSYINNTTSHMNDTKMMLYGIYAGIAYIIVFMIIGKLVLKRQEIK